MSGAPGYALSLDSVKVADRVELRNTWTNGTVTLLGARVDSDVDCTGAKFVAVNGQTGLAGMALNISSATISGVLRLRGPHQCKGELDATGAEIGVIDDEPTTWPPKGALSLNGCQYRRLGGTVVDAVSRLEWLGRQYPPGAHVPFLPHPHEQLAKVLGEMGLSDEANIVQVAKEHARRAAELHRLPWWRKPFHFAFTLMLRMVGYGYRPVLALIPAVAIITFGWIVVDRASNAGLLVQPAAAPSSAPSAVLVPLAYSLEAFTPLVHLGQVEAFRPSMSTKWGYWLQVYLWIHAASGWLIGGIAAAGVLGLFRRE